MRKGQLAVVVVVVVVLVVAWRASSGGGLRGASGGRRRASAARLCRVDISRADCGGRRATRRYLTHHAQVARGTIARTSVARLTTRAAVLARQVVAAVEVGTELARVVGQTLARALAVDGQTSTTVQTRVAQTTAVRRLTRGARVAAWTRAASARRVCSGASIGAHYITARVVELTKIAIVAR